MFAECLKACQFQVLNFRLSYRLELALNLYLVPLPYSLWLPTVNGSCPYQCCLKSLVPNLYEYRHLICFVSDLGKCTVVLNTDFQTVQFGKGKYIAEHRFLLWL